jgi:outer membrane murein-binding lipoprotein Lpp
MKTISNKWVAATALLAAAISFSAWKSGGTSNNYQDYFASANQDTTPARKKLSGKRDYKIGDLDEAMKDLDRAMADMDKNLKIDFSKMDQEMKKAMEELKKVDFDKIGHEVASALKEINWEKTRVEVDKAMREAEKSLKEIDMEKVKHDISKAKEQLDVEKIKAHIDIDKIRKNVDDGLAQARIGLDKAKKELTLLKEFIGELDKDGLIDKKKGYKIEIKKGELYINGTKQSKEVNDKYKKYFKDEDYTIRSDGEDIVHI